MRYAMDATHHHDTKSRRMNFPFQTKRPMSNRSLWSSSVLLLVLIAALDSADKNLLAASFPVLETTLHLHVDTLGYFSLFTNLSYALSLPFWGWMIHTYKLENAHLILGASCFLWGLATFGLAFFSTSIVLQAIFRSINGAALASILPLTQTMLVELVPPHQKGQAFGLLGWTEKAAATLAVSSVVWCKEDWTIPYYVVALLSIIMAVVAAARLKIQSPKETDKGEVQLTFSQIFQRISRIPAFLCLVAQGVFGGVPWDMMSFILLLLDWKGFTKEQIVILQFSSGISGTIGVGLGGFLGDWLGSSNQQGRVAVAFASVIGGIVLYGLFLFSESFVPSLIWMNLFHLWGSWAPSAALRPICAELARNPSERAQIVAFWILLEKTSSAVFGAPLVGYLTKNMLTDESDADSSVKAHALAMNLFGLSTFFWSVCACFWILMARALKQTSTQNQNEP